MSRSFLSICALIIFSPVLASSYSLAADEVIVHTTDGRALTGEIDVRSDEENLWIRRSEGNIILTTAVAWSDVDAAEVDGQVVQASWLMPRIKEYASAAPKAFLTEYEPSSVTPATTSLSIHRQPEIASIDIEAGLINLDRTVELDGLLVELAVLDSHGHAAAVQGDLTARLIVQRLDAHTGRETFEEFQRWTHRVEPVDFADSIAEIPLRFRRASPDFDWELCSSAILHVRVGVDGQGNFEASIPINIREVNPMRDEMQNRFGGRFYRDELTRNTRHSSPPLSKQNWRTFP